MRRVRDSRFDQASGAAADGQQLLDAELQPVTVLADSAYGSGQFRAELGERGHADRVKPAPTRAAVPGGFTVDDFTVDDAAGTATCPAGVTKTISRSSTRKSLKIRPHDALQRTARQAAHAPDWQAEYLQHRTMVERSIAWLVRGNRKLRQGRPEVACHSTACWRRRNPWSVSGGCPVTSSMSLVTRNAVGLALAALARAGQSRDRWSTVC